MTKSEQNIDKVPGKGNYVLRYVLGGRVFSYAHQIDSVLSFEPRSVLEVGIGPGMVCAALRAMGVDVTTIDIQPELHPDIVGSVTDLPLSDHSVDVALCCQVLEHLPFDQFGVAIAELARVADRAIVISLPDITPHYEIRVRLPRVRWSWRGTRRAPLPEGRPEQAWANDGHYWEIGFPDTPLKRIEETICAGGLSVLRTWRVSEYPFHRFFVIRSGS